VLSMELYKVEVGFCAMWALDNMFPCEGRAFAIERTDVSDVNVMLDPRDATVVGGCAIVAFSQPPPLSFLLLPLISFSGVYPGGVTAWVAFLRCMGLARQILLHARPHARPHKRTHALTYTHSHAPVFALITHSILPLAPQSLKLSPDGLEIRNDALSFESVRATCCAQGGGQWYGHD